MKKSMVVINGRGLDLPMNGIPRYMHETLANIDALHNSSWYELVLVIPESTKGVYNYSKIKVIKLPDSRAWDYLQAEAYARKNYALYINFASKGVLYKNSIATIHDVRVLTCSEGNGFTAIKSRLKLIISFWLAVKRSKLLVTISEFSKKEILSYFNIDSNKIRIIGNGWEHIEAIQEDLSIFDEYPQIKKGKYIISISSIAPHKNFKWILENKKYNPEIQYVIVGKTDPKVWKDISDELQNVLYLGFQPDEKMKALLMYSKALIFPSLYEGFGIPPLEALACGTPAIVSDIPVMHELFGDTVHYIDKDFYKTNVDKLLEKKVVDRKTTLEKYSWKDSSRKWLEIIEKQLGGV